MVTFDTDFIAAEEDTNVTKKLYRVTEDGSQKECKYVGQFIFCLWGLHVFYAAAQTEILTSMPELT